MYLDLWSVLHIIDEVTRLSAAKFVDDISKKAIWVTIFEFWATVFTALIQRIFANQGLQFGDTFFDLVHWKTLKLNELEFRHTVFLALVKYIINRFAKIIRSFEWH